MLTDPHPFSVPWSRLLQEVELADGYILPYRLMSNGALGRNPVLEAILPSLLFIKMTSLLDDGLAEAITDLQIGLPRDFRDRLFDRIELLDGAGALSDAGALHHVRERRNELAHDSYARATWDELRANIDVVHRELQSLKLVLERPKYEAFAERSAMQESDDPNVLAERVHKFGLKENGDVVVEYSSTERMYRSGA